MILFLSSLLLIKSGAPCTMMLAASHHALDPLVNSLCFDYTARTSWYWSGLNTGRWSTTELLTKVLWRWAS